MALTQAEKNKLKKYNLKGVNKPIRTNKYGKKGVVASRCNEGKLKIIHFGDSTGMGHNYSKEARKSFKARHAKNIAKGSCSAAYWADKVLWAGPKGSKKRPPSKQKHVKGINR
tara:strand:- start:66 stop:404 length:339 start_codon:yes stop_codon:yes gene_type:complete